MREDLNMTPNKRIIESNQAALDRLIIEETSAVDKSAVRRQAADKPAAPIAYEMIMQQEQIKEPEVFVQAEAENHEVITAEEITEQQESAAEQQNEVPYLFALPVIPEEEPAADESAVANEEPQQNNAEADNEAVNEAVSETAPAPTAAEPEHSKPETQQPEPEKEKSKSKLEKGVRDTLILISMMLIFALCSSVLLSSGAKNIDKVTASKNFAADVANSIISLKSDSLGTVFDLPKVYILPIDEEPAPIANPEGYGSEIREDGTEVLTYDDETISVRYWCERIYDSNCHFAEIKVAHPTQLRTAFAGGKYSTTVRRIPQEIAQQVNAVIAINADYIGYRQSGVLIRQNVTYRTNPCGWDTLLIDSEGDFHIMNDYYVNSSGILEEYKIVNTLQFGPSLVVDGEVKMINPNSGCGEVWNKLHLSPRTGIGQIGRLHYLFCCVEGRTEFSAGIYTRQLGEIMLEKGCVQAYNLDGGMSTTMVFNGEAMNYPMWGGQRVVTDLVYCATAIPNE